jgi:hypothetical protein
MNAQGELFENSDAPVPAPSLKFSRGANGVELPYWEEDGKIVRVALADRRPQPTRYRRIFAAGIRCGNYKLRRD